MADTRTLLFTCEHGGNRVPEALAPLFAGHTQELAGHRGYDIGALELARGLAATFDAPLIFSETSRLVVDLNRSEGHPGLFSEVTRPLPREEREALLAALYRPYRQAVEQAVRQALAAGKRILHIAVHSFTPVLDGVTRRADLGLLYDPARPGEARLCAAWRAALAQTAPSLTVRRNYPYRGTADGFPTALRKRFSGSEYVGIELEANQGLYADGAGWTGMGEPLGQSLCRALKGTD